tara:strand:+ start:1584 stop:3296 length:1713 start_codon:yes stop_codon:yes gene_type:complete
MPFHIFFSWQSDAPTLTGRNLIERALERAIGVLAADADVDPADRELAVDRDTAGVPGSPPLVETIFSKIDRAAVFLSDLTYIAARVDGRRMPNPNVLLEHGWALNALTWRRVISVMNIAAGNPEQHPLPFDLQHFRRPIFYDCPDDADEDTRRAARDGLTKQFVIALRAILDDGAIQEVAAAPVAPEPHPHDVALLAQVQRQLPPTLQRFLRQHNFGTPFRRDNLDPVYEMNEDWVGARFEFHDQPLQAAFAELRRFGEELGDLTAKHIHAMDQNLALGWPKTDQDVAQGLQPSTLAAIEAMNAKATEFSAAIDIFERTARDRIRVAAAAEAPAEPDPREEQAHGLLAELAQDRNRGQLPGIVTQPSVTVRAVPLEAVERRRLDPQRVAAAQLRFPPDANVRVETGSDGRQWWSIGVPRDVGKPNGESKWRTRLVRPGATEYEATIGGRIDDDPEIVIDGRQLEDEIVHALDRLGAALAELELGGRALVEISFDGIEDVILSRARPGGRKIGRSRTALPALFVNSLLDHPANALHEQFDILWQMAGWSDGSPSFGTSQWAGYDGEKTEGR